MHADTAIRRYFILGLILSFAASAHGQAVIGVSAVGIAGDKSPSTNTRTTTTPPLSSLASAFSDDVPLLRWGPLAVRPHLAYSILHGNGILRVPGEPANTTMQMFSPGVLLEVGEHWTLDYTVTRSTYSSRLLSNTTDQNASLHGSYAYDKWILGVSQSYGSNSPTLVETGGQTHEKTNSSGFDAARPLGDRSSFELTATYSARSANPLTSSTQWTGSDWRQWSATSWLRYQLAQQTNVGLGLRGGYDKVSGNPDMSYTQPQGEISWHPTEKISLKADGGVEFRKSLAAKGRSVRNTVYSASLQYAPLKTTALSLSRTQSVAASYFSDQATRNNTWGVDLQQRLIGKLYLTGGVSHGRTKYLGTTTFSATGREDRYTSMNAGLSVPFLRRGSISLSYQRGENDSQDGIYNFISHLIGAKVEYRF